MGFKAKKLVGYVRRDRIARVKAYVEKYGASVAKVALDNKGRTAMHVACRHASVYTFAYLLRLTPNLMKTDAEGNLPLHWAIAAAKKGHRNAYTDIVLPLLKLCNGAQDVPNKSGLTPRQILTDLGLQQATCPTRHNKGSYDDPYENEDDDDEEDEDSSSLDENDIWNERLRQELDDDCADSWGRYAGNGGGHYSGAEDEDEWAEPETYADWTERMFSEYRIKHDSSSSSSRRPSAANSDKYSKSASSTSSSSWSKDDQRNFENEFERQRDAGRRLSALQETLTRTKQKSQFNAKHVRLFNDVLRLDGCKIRLHDLPWSHISSAEEFVAVLLVDVDPFDIAAKKKCLREQQVQWHPDKFLQKFGSRVADEDREDVILAVNHFAQIINVALDDLAACAQNINNNN